MDESVADAPVAAPTAPVAASTEFDLIDAVALGLVTLVAAVAGISLVAAYLGVDSAGLVLVCVALLAGAGVWWWRRSDVRVARPSRSAVLLLLPGLVMATVLFFPGFRYATGDKDPGVYVLHALSIADTGHLDIPKSTLQSAGTFTFDDIASSQWRGFDTTSSATQVEPSFYHLWPALLAVAFDIAGFRALSVALPLVGLVAVLLAFSLARRLANPVAGGAAALLLATNMLEVWQAKYPTSEMLGQVLFLGAALAFVVAHHTDRRRFAALAGVLVTFGFLNRGEGVALVLATFAVAAAIWSLRRRERLAVAFMAGLLASLPLAWWQAYHTAALYSKGNGVPGAAKVAALMLLIAAGAIAVRLRGQRLSESLRARAAATSLPTALRWGASVAVVGLFLLGTLRPLFGKSYVLYLRVPIRSYDELSWHRLAWFFSWPGLVLACAGMLWVIWSKWSVSRAVVTTAVVGFTVLFCYHAKNSPYLMWWGRRFVPIVVPGIVLMIAVALGAMVAAVRQHRSTLMRGLGACAVVAIPALAVFQSLQSLDLRGHDEKGGSYGVALDVGALSGTQRGVFLWEEGPCCAAQYLLFGSATWIIGRDDSAVLPPDTTQVLPYVHSVLAAAGGRPLFVVLSTASAPLSDVGLRFTAVRRFNGSLPVWEEQFDHRPDHAIQYLFDFTVYRVEAA